MYFFNNHDVNKNLSRGKQQYQPSPSATMALHPCLSSCSLGGALPAVGHFLQCRVSPAHWHLNLLQWEAFGRLSSWVNLLCWRISRSFYFLFQISNTVSLAFAEWYIVAFSGARFYESLNENLPVWSCFWPWHICRILCNALYFLIMV